MAGESLLLSILGGLGLGTGNMSGGLFNRPSVPELPNPVGGNPASPINPFLPTVLSNSIPGFGTGFSPPTKPPEISAPDLGGLKLPASTRGGGNAPINFSVPQPGPYPQPPTIPMPPAPAEVDDFDPDKARSFLAQAGPKAPNKDQQSQSATSAILGGLARGASGVSATDPGSFARALSMAGAGGSEARNKALESGLDREHEFNKENSAWKTAQAGQELKIAEKEADVSSAKAAVAQAHSDLMWKTQVENQRAQYDAQLKEYGLKQPSIQSVSGGFMTADPGTGKGEFYSTKSVTEKAMELRSLMKALQPGDPFSDVTAAQLIMNQEWPPHVKTAALKQYLIESTTTDGKGQAVFGKLWESVYKSVSDRISKDDNYNVLRVQKPQDYVRQVQAETSAELTRRLLAAKDDSWIRDLANQGNPIAKSMLGGS